MLEAFVSLKVHSNFALHFGRGNCWLLIQSCGPPLNIRSMSLANGLQGMYDPQTQGRPGEVGDVWGLLCLSLCQLWKVSNGGQFCMQNMAAESSIFRLTKASSSVWEGVLLHAKKKQKTSGTLPMFTLNVNHASISSYKCASAIGQLSSFSFGRGENGGMYSLKWTIIPLVSQLGQIVNSLMMYIVPTTTNQPTNQQTHVTPPINTLYPMIWVSFGVMQVLQKKKKKVFCVTYFTSSSYMGSCFPCAIILYLWS